MSSARIAIFAVLPLFWSCSSDDLPKASPAPSDTAVPRDTADDGGPPSDTGDGTIDYYEFSRTLFPGDYEDCFQAQTERKKKEFDSRQASLLDARTPKRRDSGIAFIKGAMPTAVKTAASSSEVDATIARLRQMGDQALKDYTATADSAKRAGAASVKQMIASRSGAARESAQASCASPQRWPRSRPRTSRSARARGRRAWATRSTGTRV